jgi:hypothetical protein
MMSSVIFFLDLLFPAVLKGHQRPAHLGNAHIMVGYAELAGLYGAIASAPAPPHIAPSAPLLSCHIMILGTTCRYAAVDAA